MVQKYKAPVRIYKYPFELVMAAYERRFPTCHLIPVFIGSDIIDEHTTEDGSVQVTQRRCIIKVDAPYLLRKITGVDHVHFIQKNTLDRRKRVLKIEAWNETFSNHINIHELCYYRASKENWTHFEQQASLEVKQFWGFEHVVEKLAVKHYSQNVNKGAEIIEYHISELAKVDITYIPPFDASTLAMSPRSSIDSGEHKHFTNGDEADDSGGAHNNSNHAHMPKACNGETKTTTNSNKNGVINGGTSTATQRSNKDENINQQS